MMLGLGDSSALVKNQLKSCYWVGDVYCAALPPQGNSRKLQLTWSGPVEVTKIINPAMIEVKEMYVKNPWTYIVHRSKIRLAKKIRQKDVDLLFRLH